MAEKHALLETCADQSSSNSSDEDVSQGASSVCTSGQRVVCREPHVTKAKALGFWLILVFSLVTNLALALFALKNSRIHSDRDFRCKTGYASLGRDETVPFPYSSGYGPEVTNHSLADERWESIDINAGIVAISHEWAAEHNLPQSQDFPWDDSKGVYTLTSFHTLHCLKNLHRLLYDAHHGRPLSRDVGHAMHCLDHIRKDTLCNADDYLLPTPPDHYGMDGPRGQSRVCRNWDQLLAWAAERNACYQHITDDEDTFAREHDEIERYANCPQHSEYRQAMEQYFQTSNE